MGIIADTVTAVGVFLGIQGNVDFQCESKHGTATVYEADSMFTNRSLIIKNSNDAVIHRSNSSDSLFGESPVVAAGKFCKDGTAPKLFTDWTTSTGMLSSSREIAGPGGKFNVETSFFGHKTTGTRSNGDTLSVSGQHPSLALSLASRPADHRASSIESTPRKAPTSLSPIFKDPVRVQSVEGAQQKPVTVNLNEDRIKVKLNERRIRVPSIEH